MDQVVLQVLRALAGSVRLLLTHPFEGGITAYLVTTIMVFVLPRFVLGIAISCLPGQGVPASLSLQTAVRDWWWLCIETPARLAWRGARLVWQGAVRPLLVWVWTSVIVPLLRTAGEGLIALVQGLWRVFLYALTETARAGMDLIRGAGRRMLGGSP